MIIRTKIDWLQNKELTESEKEIRDAKREVLGYDFDEDEDENDRKYEEIEKNAIIDPINDKMYIEIESDKICVTRLLGGDYYPTEDGSMQRIEERLYFKCTLDDLYEQLTNNNK